MEKQRIVRLRVLNEPMHRPHNVCFSRLAHRILLIVGQEDHVFALVSEMAVEIPAHVLHIIDAAPQLTLLSKIVDANE